MEKEPAKVPENWSLEIGDSLERNFAQDIRQYIPYYEFNWAAFIGNTGANEMVVIPGFPADFETVRKRFSEHHYTIAESVLCLKQGLEEMNEISKDYTGRNVLRFQNYFLSYFAHIGRIFDNLSNCAWDIGLLSGKIRDERNKKDEFDRHDYVSFHMDKLRIFYNQRHVVSHGKKVPLGRTSDGVMLMPIISNDRNSPEGWQSSLSWRDFVNPIELLHQLSEIFDNFCKEVNQVLASIYNDLMTFLKSGNWSIISPDNAQKEGRIDVYGLMSMEDNINASGVTRIPNDTGHAGYSGFTGKSLPNDKPYNSDSSGSEGWHGSSGNPPK